MEETGEKSEDESDKEPEGGSDRAARHTEN